METRDRQIPSSNHWKAGGKRHPRAIHPVKLFLRIRKQWDSKTKTTTTEEHYSRQVFPLPPQGVYNKYASGRGQVISEGCFNIQGEMGSNENLPSGEI